MSNVGFAVAGRRSRSGPDSARRRSPGNLRSLAFCIGSCALAVQPPTPAGAATSRFSAGAFGEPLTIELRGLSGEAAAAAAALAVARAQEVEAAADPEGDAPGGVGVLNAAAGQGPRPVAAELLPLLARAIDVCRWSEGAHGPFGGRLYELWRGRPDGAAAPSAEAILAASESVSCTAGRLDPAAATLELAADARIDVGPFAAGRAVDRAVEALQGAGATDGWVAIGGVRRAFGPGPDGDGWPVPLPHLDGHRPGAEGVWLRDSALAVADDRHQPLSIDGVFHPPYLDQRSPRLQAAGLRGGWPPEGVTAVVTVTELATDAQAVAGALLILGSTKGPLYLGTLRPAPSVLWVLGQANGEPVLSTHRWSAVQRRVR